MHIRVSVIPHSRLLRYLSWLITVEVCKFVFY